MKLPDFVYNEGLINDVLVGLGGVGKKGGRDYKLLERLYQRGGYPTAKLNLEKRLANRGVRNAGIGVGGLLGGGVAVGRASGSQGLRGRSSGGMTGY